MCAGGSTNGEAGSGAVGSEIQSGSHRCFVVSLDAFDVRL